MNELFETPAEGRDDAWRTAFYAAIPDAGLVGLNPQVSTGPDTFPYFHLAVPDSGSPATLSISRILNYALENGTGAVIFADAKRSQPPEWVFTYGDLLSYKLYGSFEGDVNNSLVDPQPRQAGKLLVAVPSEALLPAAARRAIGAYMREKYRHPAPKVALVVDPSRQPAHALMFNLTLAQYHGDAKKLQAAVHYLGWFLPRTYAMTHLPEGWSEDNFLPLT
ncbi:MAG TPA: hypothetical protein VKU01_18465 [Bryobacteraceae bacterium]|nr:hypothetical protein [Bryobacteraceae bacterium]